MKRYYIKHIIKKILLDPKQSVLQTCKIGGGYMSLSTKCIDGPLVAPSCPSAVKGQQVPGKGGETTSKNASS